MSIPIQSQVRCAQRELAMRLRNYPRWVADRKMTKEKSDEEIAGMTAIVATLQKVQNLWEVSEEIKAEEEKKSELKQAELITT